jgi:hypothetical protein
MSSGTQLPGMPREKENHEREWPSDQKETLHTSIQPYEMVIGQEKRGIHSLQRCGSPVLLRVSADFKIWLCLCFSVCEIKKTQLCSPRLPKKCVFWMKTQKFDWKKYPSNSVIWEKHSTSITQELQKLHVCSMWVVENMESVTLPNCSLASVYIHTH